MFARETSPLGLSGEKTLNGQPMSLEMAEVEAMAPDFLVTSESLVSFSACNLTTVLRRLFSVDLSVFIAFSVDGTPQEAFSSL